MKLAFTSAAQWISACLLILAWTSIGRATPPSTPISVELSLSGLPGLDQTTTATVVVESTRAAPGTRVEMVLPPGVSARPSSWSVNLQPGVPLTFKSSVTVRTSGALAISARALRPAAPGEIWGDMKSIPLTVGTSPQAPAAAGWKITQVLTGRQVSRGDTPIISTASSPFSFQPTPPNAPGEPLPVLTPARTAVPMPAMKRAGSITIKGRWFYNDRSGVQLPINQQLVEIRKSDSGELSPRVFCFTDIAGNFSCTFANPGTGVKAWVRSWTNFNNGVGGADRLGVFSGPETTGGCGSDAINCSYPVQTGVLTCADGATCDLGGWVVPNSEPAQGATWMTQDLIGSWIKIFFDNKHGGSVHAGPGRINYPVPAGHGTHAHVPPADGWISIEAPNQQSSHIVTHEYGHVVMANLWSGFGITWPTSDCPSPHFIESAGGVGCALSEGWGDFWSWYSTNDPIFSWPSGATSNFETRAGYDSGDAVEGNIAGIMGDLFDFANDGPETADKDRVSDGVQHVWHTISSLGNRNFQEWFNAYVAEGHNACAFLEVVHFNSLGTYSVPGCAQVGLSISANPSNGGTVAGGGFYHPGSVHTVTATPNANFSFRNWTENGSVVSTFSSYNFLFNSARTLVANFVPFRTIVVSASPTAGGTVSGGGSFADGSSRTVTATANAGYRFLDWREGSTTVSTSASFTFTLTGDRTLVARFLRTGTIVLSASPSAGGTVSGAGTFDLGTSRSVKATPNGGYRFVSWTEGSSVVSRSASFTFTLTANRNLVAHFLRVFTINVSASPTSRGTVSGGGTFDVGTSRTLRATPRSGSVFINWTEGGVQVSNRATYTFTLSRNRTLVAHFKAAHVAANDVVADLGSSGLWEYLNNSTWRQIHPNSPVLLATGDLDGDGKDEVLATFANGFWTRYASDGRWYRLSAGIPVHIAVGDLDNSGKDDVIADYGNGVFVRMNNSGNFVKLTSLTTTLLATLDLNGNGKDELVGVFSTGTSARYDNAGVFRSLTTDKLQQIVQGDLNGDGRPDLIGTATGVGVEALIANTKPWVKLSSNVASRLAAGDLNGSGKDEVIAVFNTGVGTFARYDNAGSFRSVNAQSVVHPVTVDLDRNGKDDLIGDFAGKGIYAFKNNTAPWVRLNAVTSQRLATGGFD